MIINFYRLYGVIFYTVDVYEISTIYYANTTEDYQTRFQRDRHIPSSKPLTDRQAKEWFKTNYPDYKIHKVDKHFHTQVRMHGDRMGD